MSCSILVAKSDTIYDKICLYDGSSQIAMQTDEFCIAVKLQIESFTWSFVGVNISKLLDYLGTNGTSYAERK